VGDREREWIVIEEKKKLSALMCQSRGEKRFCVSTNSDVQSAARCPRVENKTKIKIFT